MGSQWTFRMIGVIWLNLLALQSIRAAQSTSTTVAAGISTAEKQEGYSYGWDLNHIPFPPPTFLLLTYN